MYGDRADRLVDDVRGARLKLNVDENLLAVHEVTEQPVDAAKADHRIPLHVGSSTSVCPLC